MAKPEQTLANLRALAKDAQRIAVVDGIWPEMKRQKAFLADLFEASRALNAAGDPFKLPSASRAHYLWKIRNGLDPRSFHMTNATQRAFHSPSSLVLNQFGATISIPRANVKGTVPGRAKSPGKRARKQRSAFVNTYFRFIQTRAGGRLGKLGLKQKQKVKAAGKAAIGNRAARLLKTAMTVRGGVKIVKAELGKLGLEA